MSLDLARQTSRYLSLAQAQLMQSGSAMSPLEEESRGRAGLWFLSLAWQGFLVELADAYILKVNPADLLAYIVSPAKGSLDCSALEQLQELYEQRQWLYGLLNAKQALENGRYSFKTQAAHAKAAGGDFSIALSATDKLEDSHSLRACFTELGDLIEQHRNLQQEY